MFTLTSSQKRRVAIGAVVAAVALFLLYWFTPPSEIVELESGVLTNWSKLRAVRAEQKKGSPRLRHTWVSITDVPLEVQMAVVSVRP